MSRHNRERRLFRAMKKAGHTLTPYQTLRTKHHGKRLIAAAQASAVRLAVFRLAIWKETVKAL